MIAELNAFGMTLTELVVLGGLALAALEVAGLSRSGRTARKDNIDLRERNTALEEEAKRLDNELALRDVRIEALETKVATLDRELADVRQRDQGAVLDALADHERSAVSRGERTIGVLMEIRDAVKAA